MSKQIEISLEFKGRQVDYKIPSEITLGRLNELMHVVLKDVKLPQAWMLVLKDKPIHIDQSDRIKDLPIGNGDIFLIRPLQIQEKQG
jgi:hypothetical protein